MRNDITVKSNIKIYTVKFCNIEDEIDDIIKKTDIFFIDSNIQVFAPIIWKKIANKKVICLEASEKTKNITSIYGIYDKIIQLDIKRNNTVCTIGGGTIQDAAGFICSTFMRGINYIYIPTTFVAQSDSCMGGKTSINFGRYKNLIGTFYPPNIIHIDPSFIKTQNILDFYNGMGEMAKICIINGEESVEKLHQASLNISQDCTEQIGNLIELALQIKLPYVEQDEYDTDLQQILNYGHCFGHAIEAASGFKIPHGQSVLFGIWAANILSVETQKLSESKHINLLDKIIIPLIKVKLKNKQLSHVKIIEAMKRDKKRYNEFLSVICLDDNYSLVKTNDITVDNIINTIETLTKELMINNLISD